MGNSQESKGSKFRIFDDDGQGDSYKDIKGEVKKFCKCSLRTRIILFAIFAIVGWALSVLAVLIYFLRKDVVYFAVLYSIGQLLNLAATFFLVGPCRQLKLMTASKRIVVSLLYIGSTIGTVVFALVLPDIVILTVACLIVQVVSYFFYCLTYIPFGQKMLKKACSCCIDSVSDA